jgi:hypothetical protein
VTWFGFRNKTWSGCFGSCRELFGLNMIEGFDSPVAWSGCCMSTFLVTVEI